MSRLKIRIKSDDTVKVIAGKAKGQIGKVAKVFPNKGKVIVEGVNKVKRHQKPVGDQPGGIVVKEAAIAISNVALWDEEAECRIKVGYDVDADGKKIRVNRSTRAPIDKD